MDGTNMRRKLLVFLGCGFVAMVPLAVALDAAGPDVSLAVWIAAMAVLVAAYVRIGVLMFRAYRASPGEPAEDSEPVQRVRRATGALLYVMPAYIFVAMAANIGDPLRLVLAYLPVVACQFVFLHVTIVVGVILRGRRRRTDEGAPTRPRRTRPVPPGGPPW